MEDNKTEVQSAEGSVKTESETQYAGKFNSVDSLEKGYKDLEKYLGSKNSSAEELDILKKQTSIPETYSTEKEIDTDVLLSLQSEANALGLNQSQFDKFIDHKITERESKESGVKVKQEELLKLYGEDTFNQLKLYMQKEHGLSDSTVNNLSKEEIEFFNGKRKALNESSIDNVSHYSQSKVTRQDVDNALNSFYAAKKSGNIDAANSEYKKYIKLSRMSR